MSIDKKQLEEFIEQPLEGLLYDLDLLPEQTKQGTREDLIRQVVVLLYDKLNQQSNK
jgi:hypothetical protein